MIDVARSITINRPVAEVFAYVSEVSNEPAWHTDVLEARQTSAGPIGIGTTFLIRVKPSMGVSEGGSAYRMRGNPRQSCQPDAIYAP